MPEVVVKTGGTHQFGSPGEAAEFLDLFLEKAGFVKEFRWEARLEKTAHCSWDSPPVRVVGYKHWVIYLRVKPSINATVDHFVSLLIPDGFGYGAETVYRQLKGLVKSFNRYVRTNGHRKKILEPAMEREAIPTVPSPAPAPPPEEEAVMNGSPAADDRPHEEAADVNGTAEANGLPPADEAAPAEPTPSFDSLAGVTRHPEKLRYVLTHIDRVSQLGVRDALSFKKTLRRECEWTHHPLRATSLILAWLCKHGYVQKILDENEVVTNYTLTPRGQLFIAGGPRAEPTGAPRPAPKAAPAPPPPQIDHGELLIRFREKAQELADAGRRLEANRQKYRELQQQMKQLDEEYQEIAKLLLVNREATALLARLLEIQGSVPIKT
jgi:hypothetical protein